MATNPTALDIEQLKKKHRELEKAKTTAEANLNNATEQLELLKAEAREKYGTDDLEQLRKKLQQMQEENERKRADYQKHVEQIEASLADVQKQFDQSRQGE